MRSRLRRSPTCLNPVHCSLTLHNPAQPFNTFSCNSAACSLARPQNSFFLQPAIWRNCRSETKKTARHCSLPSALLLPPAAVCLGSSALDQYLLAPLASLAPTCSRSQCSSASASSLLPPVMSLIYSPGPAAYDIGSGIGKAPSTTLKGRYKDRAATDNPGPGAYNLADTVGQGLQYTLRPKTNLPAEGPNTPGPGQSRHTHSNSEGQRDRSDQPFGCRSPLTRSLPALSVPPSLLAVAAAAAVRHVHSLQLHWAAHQHGSEAEPRRTLR